MVDRKSALVFCTGVALGSVGTALLLKYHAKNAIVYTTPIQRAISEATYWPVTALEITEPKRIYVISKPSDFDNVITDFLEETNNVKIVGFDCEWTSKDASANPIALLQLCTSVYTCYLFRLNKLDGILPNEVLGVLKNKAVLKVGVGVLDDASKLSKDHRISVQGCLDLRGFAVRYQITGARGLKTLAKELINMTLDKSYHLRCSDWDKVVLTDAQIRYAAFDAFSALRIFEAMLLRKFDAFPSNHEDIKKASFDIVWTVVRSSVQGLIDAAFKEKKCFKSTKCDDLKLNNNCQNTKNTKGIPKNPKLFKSMKLHSTRQQPLYDNCKLQAPDGQLLSTCDRKKALWYIEKKLAELMCEDPLTIRLYFEPSGRPDNDRDYYLYEKENKCVVCGSTESFVRKNIIPHEYRKHFALAMKDHTSHDILLLCLPCHQQSNYYDCLFRRQLSEEYKAPQGSLQAIRLFENPGRRSVRSAGRAILNTKNKLPNVRQRELEEVIIRYFSVDKITDVLISKAAHLETRVENEMYVPHGEKVVLSIFKEKGSQGLMDFEKRWREHFLSNMKPKHLPVLWSVDHNHEKAKRKFKEMEEEYQSKVNAMKK